MIHDIYLILLLRLASASANAAGVPSVLITNFTFDSVFSYLSTSMVDSSESQQAEQIDPTAEQLPPDLPIPSSDIEPLVKHIWSGYRCADLLLRLPGAIPIPSFFDSPTLPSPKWVDPGTRAFTPHVVSHLLEPPTEEDILEAKKIVQDAAAVMHDLVMPHAHGAS